MNQDYTWPNFWKPIADMPKDSDYPHHGFLYQELTDEPVAQTLEEELYRELPLGHILEGLTVQAIGFNTKDPSEFIFKTDDKTKKFVRVHLTWTKEKDSLWPSTETYSTFDVWAKKERETT